MKSKKITLFIIAIIVIAIAAYIFVTKKASANREISESQLKEFAWRDFPAEVGGD